METRIIPDMPFAEYAAAPGINATALKIAHQQSLAHVKAYMDGMYQKESTALDFGKAFHALALEDREDFVIRPSIYLHPKDGEKPWNGNAAPCKAWLAEHDGAIILTGEEAQCVRAMSAAVHHHINYPLGGQAEVSVFAERDGLPVKCRVDFLPNDDGLPVFDLKSCRSAHPEQFMRDAFRLGYHIQAAWVLDCLRRAGIKREVFRFVAVEVEPPHAVCMVDFRDTDLSALRMGRVRANALFHRVAEARRTDRWTDYGTQEAEQFIPPWMIPELEQTTA